MSGDGDDRFEGHGYRVVEVLGRNLQGGRITYLCEALEGGGRVVLKTFSFARGEADWSGYKAHERELEILEGLDHPQIPEILGAFPLEDGFAMVQEWRDAATLAAPRVWEVDEVVDVATQVLSVLVYLQGHAPAIIHRDIKPENILRDEAGEVSLIDFGFARPQSAEGNASSVAMGTPGYMAPEQMLNQAVDASTDLYGLGATLVALGSGVASGDLSKLVSSSFRLPMDRLDAGYSEEWRAWLERMTEPDRARRFSSAREALEALERLEPRAARALAKRASKRASKLPSDPGNARGGRGSPRGERDPRWPVVLAVALTVAVGLVIFSPLIMLMFRSSEPTHSRYDFMVWDGDDFACLEPGPRVFDGPANGVEELDEVLVGNGCELTLSGVKAGAVDVEGASAVFEGVAMWRLYVKDGGEARMKGGSLTSLASLGKDNRVHLSDVTFRVDRDTDAYELRGVVVCERCAFEAFEPKYDFWRAGVEVEWGSRASLIAPELNGMPIYTDPSSYVEVLPEGASPDLDALAAREDPARPGWVREVEESGESDADRVACRGFVACLVGSGWRGERLDVSMALGPTGKVTRVTGTYPDEACFTEAIEEKDVGAVGFGGGSLECVLGLARPEGQLVVTEHVGAYVRSESTVVFEREDDTYDEE